MGPGLVDLAALVAGKWTEDEKEALALAYHAALPGDRADRPTAEEFLRDLHDCRLHLAVQWLGWSAEWRPPAEHDHDWLGEAIMLAEKRWP